MELSFSIAQAGLVRQFANWDWSCHSTSTVGLQKGLTAYVESTMVQGKSQIQLYK